MKTLAESVLDILGENGEHWIRNFSQKNIPGRGVCYCIYGAMIKIKRDMSLNKQAAYPTKSYEALYKAIHIKSEGTDYVLYGRGVGVVQFNDIIAKNFADIKAMCLKWRELEEAA